MYLRIYMFSIYTCSFLDLAQQFTVWLLPLLASLKVICSCRVSVLSFLQTSPSPVPLPYNFGGKTQEVEVPSHSPWPALRSVEACQAHFPAQAFKTSSRDALRLHEWYKPWIRALLVFHVPQGILASLSLFLSLPLFSTLSFSWDRPTPGQRPFAIRPPSIHHKFLPDPVAQGSSDGTLGRHRLLISGFPGNPPAKRPSGEALGRSPSLLRSLSPFARSKD